MPSVTALPHFSSSSIRASILFEQDENLYSTLDLVCFTVAHQHKSLTSIQFVTFLLHIVQPGMFLEDTTFACSSGLFRAWYGLFNLTTPFVRLGFEFASTRLVMMGLLRLHHIINHGSVGERKISDIGQRTWMGTHMFPGPKAGYVLCKGGSGSEIRWGETRGCEWRGSPTPFLKHFYLSVFLSVIPVARMAFDWTVGGCGRS